jgi:hypothetical protein
LKKAALGILIFFITLLLSFLWFFPTESIVKNALWQLHEKSGMSIEYERGVFSLNRVELYTVNIFDKGKHLITFKELSGVFWPGSQRVEILKGDGNLQADISSANVDLKMKNFQLVSEGRKFFQEVFLTGEFKYGRNDRRGKGKFSATLLGSKDPFLNSDVEAEFDIETSPRDINVNITQLNGENITGDGRIFISVNERAFGNSMISGTLRLNIGPEPVRIRISGTIDQPSAAPVMPGR